VALYDRVQSEMVDARMRRDDVALDTLALLKSELVRASKEGGSAGKIDDDLVTRVARKEVKRREEAIDVYRKAGRVARLPAGGHERPGARGRGPRRDRRGQA